MSTAEKIALEEKVSRQTEEIAELKKQLNTKVSKLKQVEAMKKMIKDKNDEIKDLRDQLAKHEG